MLSSSGFNAAIACCRLDGCRSEKKLSWLVARRHTRRWDSGEINSRDWPLLLAEGAVQWFICRPSMVTAVRGGGAATGLPWFSLLLFQGERGEGGCGPAGTWRWEEIGGDCNGREQVFVLSGFWPKERAETVSERVRFGRRKGRTQGDGVRVAALVFGFKGRGAGRLCLGKWREDGALLLLQEGERRLEKLGDRNPNWECGNGFWLSVFGKGRGYVL